MNEQVLELRRQGVPVAAYDESLPIVARREEIIAAIRRHQVLIVAGETGSGKTTQLPRFCLEAGRGLHGLVGCTQPRRIAARAMAARVSEELGCELGDEIGFQVRFRERLSPDSYVKFMTDGILLAEAVSDRRLRAYDTLIIDEAHERSLNIDFLLGYLKRLLPRRPDLKLIITSATIDTEKFARHFDDAPVIEVSGRGYPVDVLYQPLGEIMDDTPSDKDLYRAIGEAVQSLNRIDPRGDILVFLSGEREIHGARDYLARAGLRGTEVLPLYARLSAAEQQRVFHPGAARRIILTTNVAETSLTVPRIRFVIDSGLARISRYSHRSRIQRLPIEPVSRASADQRKGRCGRLGPGTCVRLYSEEDFEGRPEFTEPEILRTSLASVILRMLTMGLGAVEDFPFVDPPAPRMIKDAYQLLFELGALDASRSVTPLGRRLARWPMDVRMARMVEAGAEHGCLEDTMVLAAALSIQDPRERPLEAQQAADEAHERFAHERSDFVSLLQLWEYLRRQRRALSGNRFRKLCRREYLAWQRVLEWFDLYQQLRDQAREQRLRLAGGHGDYEALHRALLTGLLSHVGQKDPESHAYRGVRNRSFHLFPGSGLFGKTPQWVMAAEIVETSRPYARTNARVEPAWIEAVGAHLLRRAYLDPHWSRRRGRVMAWEQVSFQGLVLVEKRAVDYGAIDPGESRRLFIRHALVRDEFDQRVLGGRSKRLAERLGFLRFNRRERAAAERLEHKRRQRDVLADERDLEEFFDARLPAGVRCARTLADWLESLDEAGLRQLRLGRAVLLRAGAGQAPAELYPDHWPVAGRELPLNYRFEPGDPADGVTLSVPLELLNTLDPAALSWLVPGLLREKILELLRTLPKPLRRALTPLPGYADAAWERLARDGADDRSADQRGDLAVQLAAVLGELAGVTVSGVDFDPAQLSEHLRMRVRVLGRDGETLAEDRDLAALQERLGGEAQRRFMARQGEGFNRDGLRDWDFGALPENVTTEAGVEAWPALVKQDSAVGLRLFETAEEALAEHREGVLGLLALRLADKLRWLAKHHGLPRSAQLAWVGRADPVPAADELVRDLARHALYECAEPDLAEVRDAQAFEALAERVRAGLGPAFQRLVADLARVMESLPELERRLAGLADRGAVIVDDLDAWLADLVYPGFLLELEPGRFRHYPRYLASAGQRLDAQALDPSRDTRLQEQLARFQSRYDDWLAAGKPYLEELDAYRWLLAEYRVSLFAQRLGTQGKVSPKRLQKAWQTVLDAESEW